MTTSHGDPLTVRPAIAPPGRTGNESLDVPPHWRRAVAALQTPDQQRPVSPPERLPAVFSDLPPALRAIVGAILQGRALAPELLERTVEQQRALLRAGGLRRADDIETLAILVRLLVERPLTGATAVNDLAQAYHHLKRTHWWPSGPEDLPLCALLAAAPAPIDELIARIERLHLTLSEGDEVPDDTLALVLLCWTASRLPEQEVVLRLRDLRTELVLSSIPLLPEDGALLPYFAGIDQPPEAVITLFSHHRQTLQRENQVPSTTISIALAGDLVMLALVGDQVRPAVIAAVVISAWLAHRRRDPHPPARLVH